MSVKKFGTCIHKRLQSEESRIVAMHEGLTTTRHHNVRRYTYYATSTNEGVDVGRIGQRLYKDESAITLVGVGGSIMVLSVHQSKE